MTTLNSINIKGKQYVTVNERLKYFREKFPNYGLETKVLSLNDDSTAMQAIITNEDGRIIAVGTAREVRTDKSSFVNATSYVENCETSAWGRALANLGIGIDENVASADEVSMAIKDADSNEHAPKDVPADKQPQPKLVSNTPNVF